MKAKAALNKSMRLSKQLWCVMCEILNRKQQQTLLPPLKNFSNTGINKSITMLLGYGP